MDTIIYGCSVTNKEASGSYEYYLYSRIDNYALILRAKTDGTEYLFRVVLQTENTETVFANRETETYLRPDEMDEQTKRYILNKMKNFVSAISKDVEKW
jgi:hypothetical protein